MLIVQLCDFGSDGDARYRVHDPSRALGRLGGVTAVDCHFFSRFLPDLIGRADVLVLQFVMDWELTGLCLRRRAAGKVTVFEANDYFFDLQPWNPIAGPWQDRTVQELYLQLLKLADGVQTSTNELAKRWRRLGAKNVAVFPNQLTEVSELPAPASAPLTVGWAGSPGHLADLYSIAPPLERWLNEHPQTHLAIMTNDAARSFFTGPPERYHFEPFGSLESYFRFLQRLDIGLAPLLPTDYNRCRSDVKFLEYASQGVAGVYANLEPYRGIVEHGETGLLFNTEAELISQLERLRVDSELRQRLRRQGHGYVKRDRLLANHIESRLRWYQGLLNRSSQAESLPVEILSQAERDAGYVRLPPQEPERTLRDALNIPAAAQSSPALAQLLERKPGYLTALQHQGRLLNDLRQHRAALEILERARQLRPDSARTLCEIGRAWYRLDDDAKALAALDQAVSINPHFLTAWQYLLRMLSVNQDPTGPRRAEEAEAVFPSCYPLALLGAATHPADQAPTVLLRILTEYSSRMDANARIAALPAFRNAILAAIKAAPRAVDVLRLLRRACETFPESPRFAAELGSALIAAGHQAEGLAAHARAAWLRRNGTIASDEFGQERGIPLAWQLAEHIRAADRP